MVGLFHPNQQRRLIQTQGDGPLDTFKSALATKKPWESIRDFTMHPSFCGQKLYPRQLTLLKLIYLETEHMTPYDIDVIEEWREGFKQKRDVFGVQPDVWERVEFLKSKGYTHFPHVQSVLGRRAGKGFIGGILGAERIAYLHSLDSWQRHYSLKAGTEGWLQVFATSQQQAQRTQFADIRYLVEQCKYLQPWISTSKEGYFSIRTPADLRRIAELESKKVRVEREIASLKAIALSSNSATGRGLTTFCLDPETPILTADLRWVPLRSVQVGDELVAVDENPESGKQRKIRKTVVLNKGNTFQKSYRLTFDDGRTVTCSANHRWLVRHNTGGKNFHWRHTVGKSAYHSIKPGTKIVELVKPWENDDSRDAGYLAGAFDGEGHVAKNQGIVFTQNPGIMLDKVSLLMKEKGFNIMPCNSNAYKERTEKQCEQWALRGLPEVLRFLGQIRPERIQGGKYWEGISLRGGGRRLDGNTEVLLRTVVSVEELPEQTLIDLETSERTFIANGLVSHNSIFFDEMAHMIFGSGSTKSGEEIYDCLDPSTRILCADLVWRPIGELSVGDKLVGYDEEADKPGVGGRRRLRETEVLGLWHQKPQPTYRITFLDGSSVVCSGNHRWLRVNSVKGGGHNAPRWSAIDPRHEPGKRTTRPLRVGDHIKFLVEPWETDNTHDGGWLSGMIDGEGHMVANQGARRIGISQNEGPVLERLLNVLKGLGFEFTDNHVRPEGFYSGRNHLKPNHQVFVNRLEQCLRLLGQFRPTRLLSRHKEVWEGRTISNAQSVKTIESIERIEDRVLVDIETGTSTFVAEGLISHNSAEPSLDQFGTDRLIYIPSSPLTKIGKFFELYRHGTVLMKSQKPDGSSEMTRVDAKMLGLSDDDIEEGIEEAIAEPEMLIFQGPSWIAYQDWERSKSLGMPKFKRAVQVYDERMQRLEQRNPEKFKVERRGQFADVQGAYLNPDKVDLMFEQPTWRAPLAPQANGLLMHQYRIHCDPGRTNANFALAIGHLEDAPKDEYGEVWPHVIFDYLKVWNPADYPDHTIDYLQVQNEIGDILRRFPSTQKISFDLWNSAGPISMLRQEFSPRIRILEESFNEGANQKRAELFKSALNLGWIHCLAGETRVLTPEGSRPIKELAGGTHKIMTTGQADGRGGGTWVDAPISSFGVQSLMRITLRRNGVDKIIHATDQHRWFVRRKQGTASYRDEVLTKDLKPGQKLAQCYAQRHKATRPSPIGIAHGFTFGDGTRSRKGSVAQFCGEKDKALIPYFDLHPIVDVAPGIRRALDLPKFFKDRVDLAESPSYLYGWLAGYFAADGHVTKDGRAEIDSNDWQNLEHVRAVCNLLGVHTTSIRTKPSYGGGYTDADGYAVNLDRGDLTEDFFLIEEHRNRWKDNESRPVQDYRGYTVVAVENTERFEEVFCAEVPKTHSFVLEDNILTGNCYRDDFGDQGTCLLEQEMKFLTEVNGKVKKQDFGPVTTKDLWDCVAVVSTTLLHDALDIWMKRLGLQGSFGSTDASGLRHGREFERMSQAGMGYRGNNMMRQRLENNSLDRLRGRSDKPTPYLTRGGRWK